MTLIVFLHNTHMLLRKVYSTFLRSSNRSLPGWKFEQFRRLEPSKAIVHNPELSADALDCPKPNKKAIMEQGNNGK